MNPAHNDQVDPAKTDPVDPAETTPRERGTPPPGETDGPRARSPTGLALSSTSYHEAFLTAQATAGATGSVTPPGHRTIRSSSSSVDPSLLASRARFKARFRGIYLHLGALTQAQYSGTQRALRLYRTPTPVLFHLESSVTSPVQIEPRSGRRVRDTLTDVYESDSSLERESSHLPQEPPVLAHPHIDHHGYTQTPHAISAAEMGLPSVQAECASREQPQLGIGDRGALTAQKSGELMTLMRGSGFTAQREAQLDNRDKEPEIFNEMLSRKCGPLCDTGSKTVPRLALKLCGSRCTRQSARSSN